MLAPQVSHIVSPLCAMRAFCGMSGAGQIGLRTALLAALLVVAPLNHAFAACDPAAPRRTIELSAGQHIGGAAKGFVAAPLREHEIILTFDDGPNPETTPLILDMLEANCVPATFFLIGPSASAFPELVKREIANGHAIGGHTWSHEVLTEKPIVTPIADITRGFRPLTAVGAQANLFRFPSMSSSIELLDWLKRHGIAAVGADIDTDAAPDAKPGATLEAIKSQLRKKGRGVVLLKDSDPNTVKLLPGLIEFLRRERYTVVRLKPPSPDQSSG